MLRLDFAVRSSRPLRVMCIGAHSDDIEIGCGGTVLELLSRRKAVDVTWIVMSACAGRGVEARRSAARFLRGARRRTVLLNEFRDGYFPSAHVQLKEYFETLKSLPTPDVILSHQDGDMHQDHRLVAELTGNTFRDHLVLGYEIPKYDGDLGRPGLYVPLSDSAHKRKVDLLMQGFASQRSKRWFTPDTFYGLMRLRGVECNAPGGFAEAFVARKIVV